MSGSRNTGMNGDAGGPVRDFSSSGMSPLLILAVVLVFLTVTAGCTGIPSVTGKPTLPVETSIAATVVPVTTVPPTPTPDPFPQALALKQVFPFGSAGVASEATVYRYWMNDTYHWLNNQDNHYYTTPDPLQPGYKYLFVFVRMENKGTTRVWYPPSRTIAVHYNGTTYWPDQSHYLPDKSENEKDAPVEIQEIQYYQKLDGSEYIEDFGYSHGTNPDFLYPGESNALDGYIIYQVPASLSPESSYVDIPFNGQERGIWRLA